MKRNPLLLTLVLAMTLFAVSCKKGGKTGLLVPKEASVVLYFNSGSLSSKLSWEDIKKSGWFQEASKEASDSFAQKVLQDPSVSGLDIDKGFCFFVAARGRGGYLSFQGSIKDAAAFEEMIKQADKTTAEPETSGDLKIMRMDNSAVLTWNKSTFLLVADAPMNAGGFSRKFPSDSLVAFAKNIYSLKGDDLLDSDSRFADLVQGKGDIHLWADVGGLYKNMSLGSMMDMMKISVLMDGNISTGTLNFDDGKIALVGKQFYGKEMTKLFSKYESKAGGSALTSRLPEGEVLVAGIYNYPFEAITEMIKLIGADGMANTFLGQKGISLEDISKAFKGEIAFAMPEITKKTDTVSYEGPGGQKSSYTTNKSEPQFVFGMSIADQKSFDKIFNSFSDELGQLPASTATVKTEKGWLTVSNSSSLMDGFLAGNNKPAYSDKINGHAFGMFFNIQKFIDLAGSESGRSSSEEMKAAKETWQDVVMSGDYEKGVGTFEIDVNMVDKKTNSLKQINMFADKIAAIEKAKKSEMEEMDAPVSTEAPPKAFN